MTPGWPLVEALMKGLGIENTEMVASFDLHLDPEAGTRVTVEWFVWDPDANSVESVVKEFKVVPIEEAE